MNEEGDPAFKETGLKKVSVIKTEKNYGGPPISHPKGTRPPFPGTLTKSKSNTRSDSWD